jgi:hypothetical protein
MKNLIHTVRNMIYFVKIRLLRYFGVTLLAILILLLILPFVSALLLNIQIGFLKSNRFLELYLYTIGYGSDSVYEQMPQIVLYIFALIGVLIVSILTAYITIISFKRTKNIIVNKDINIEVNNDNKYICMCIENTGKEIYDLSISLMWYKKVTNPDDMEKAHNIDSPISYAALPKKTKITPKFKIDDLNSILLKKTANDSIILVSYLSYMDNFFGQQYIVKKKHKIAGNNVMGQKTYDKIPINLFDAIPINSEAIDLYKNDMNSLHADIHFDKKNSPPFTMALLLFEEPYFNGEDYPVFEFLIKGKGLSQIKLEIKDKNKMIITDISISITNKFTLNQFYIYDHTELLKRDRLREINEICFTVFPKFFMNKKKLKGDFTIKDFKLIQLEEQKETEAQIASVKENIDNLQTYSLFKAKPINEEGIKLLITENDTLFASVNLSKKNSPPYTTVLLLFEESYLNWEECYISNYVFEVMIRGKGLSKMVLEIKDKNKRIVINEILKITDKFEPQKFTLSNYLKKENFREISEICFKVSKGDFKNKKRKMGNFEIKHCKLFLP